MSTFTFKRIEIDKQWTSFFVHSDLERSTADKMNANKSDKFRQLMYDIGLIAGVNVSWTDVKCKRNGQKRLRRHTWERAVPLVVVSPNVLQRACPCMRGPHFTVVDVDLKRDVPRVCSGGIVWGLNMTHTKTGK